MINKSTITKNEMDRYSIGIAVEMSKGEVALYLADNGEINDRRIIIFELSDSGSRVAATNGDPIWEGQDEALFAEMLETEGIEF